MKLLNSEQLTVQQFYLPKFNEIQQLRIEI